MAYENGKQVNRYANKIEHKRRQWEKCFSPQCSFFPVKFMSLFPEDYWLDENKQVEYWRAYDYSTNRVFAKKQTNKRLRQDNRKLNDTLYYENFPNYQHGQFHKQFDYWWAVY
jgi:hypothetical protein